MNNSQLQVLPYVLQGRTDDYIRTVLKRDKIYYTDERVATIRKTLLAELRIWFTLDMLERFGTYGEVRQNLVALFSKPVSSRMVIGPAPEAQVIESQVHEDISLAV